MEPNGPNDFQTHGGELSRTKCDILKPCPRIYALGAVSSGSSDSLDSSSCAGRRRPVTCCETVRLEHIECHNVDRLLRALFEKAKTGSWPDHLPACYFTDRDAVRSLRKTNLPSKTA